MKTWMIILILIALIIGCVPAKMAGDKKVRVELANMMENSICRAKSMDKSFKSINISEYTETYLVINKINDIDICSKDVENIVVTLQRILEDDPAIDRNIGPYIFAFMDNGKRNVKYTSEVINSGKLSKCPYLYISVRDYENNGEVKRSRCTQTVK